MKLSSKIASLVLTLSLVIGASVTAFAAPNDDVIQALKDAKVPATYITQAQNYLNTVTLTAAQATAVKTQVDIVTATLTAAGTKDVTALSAAQKSTVINAITAAGSAIDLTVTITKTSTGSEQIVAKKADGTTAVTFTSSEVKQTGANDLTLVAGMFLIVLAAGSVFVIKRVKA